MLNERIFLALFVLVSASNARVAERIESPEAVNIKLKLAKMFFARGVENREPTDIDSVFPSDIQRVFAWTLVEGLHEGETTEIRHIWYYNGKEMAVVRLKINTPRFRTWSSKRILPEWKGSWKVDVVDEKDKVLGSASFRIE